MIRIRKQVYKKIVWAVFLLVILECHNKIVVSLNTP